MVKKRNFKTYKSNRRWLIAAVVTATIAIGGVNGITLGIPESIAVAHADENVDSWMPDANLQQNVAQELRSEKIITGNDFSQADLGRMTNLQIDTHKPNNLEGLQYATSLKSLVISNDGTNSGILSLTPLEKLINLQKLELDNNRISDLSPLKDLTDLTELHLNSNNISDIQPLSGLTKLTHLELGNNKLSDSDTTALKSLVNLNYLKISGNSSLTNLNNLSALKNLVELQASDLPNLTDINGIRNSSNIITIVMSRDDISDISAFKGFTGLKSVTLDSNHISDLSPLDGSFKGGISSTEYLSAHAQTVPLSSVPIDYGGQKVSISNGTWSVNNDSYTYRFDGNANLPDPINKQSISASDYTTYVGAPNPTVADFRASATDKDGNKLAVTIDLANTDLTRAGVYDVTIKSADGQSKIVKLIVKDNTPAPQPVQTGTVTTRYLDQRGNKIAADNIQKGDVGSSYSTTQKNISGYTFSKVNGNSTGTYTNGNTDVTYIYNKNVTPTPVKKGQAVYAIKKIGLYSNKNFSKNDRKVWYNKLKRTERPMFVVTGYSYSKNGNLRYKVRDVNHGKKTDKLSGYITANKKYVLPAYYSSLPKFKKVTVINPKGINAYKSVNLIGKSVHYKKGKTLKVVKFKKHNLTTRYVLSNGYYITANKKLIISVK